MRRFRRIFRMITERRYLAALKLSARTIRNDRGGEVIEYALVAGLIVVACIGVISCIGIKVLNRWNQLSSSL